VGARFSAPVQTGSEAHPASCTMGTGSFLGVRCCRGVTLTPHPLLVQRSKIESSWPMTGWNLPTHREITVAFLPIQTLYHGHGHCRERQPAASRRPADICAQSFSWRRPCLSPLSRRIL